MDLTKHELSQRGAVSVQERFCLVARLRARSICSPHTVNEELQRNSDALREYGCPDKYLTKHVQENKHKQHKSIAPKEELLMHLPFEDDSTADTLYRRLKYTVEKTYFAARIRIVYYNKPLLGRFVRDGLLSLIPLMLIYQYSCSSDARYVRRLMRRLSQSICEQMQAWFHEGEIFQQLYYVTPSCNRSYNLCK